MRSIIFWCQNTTAKQSSFCRKRRFCRFCNAEVSLMGCVSTSFTLLPAECGKNCIWYSILFYDWFTLAARCICFKFVILIWCFYTPYIRINLTAEICIMLLSSFPVAVVHWYWIILWSIRATIETNYMYNAHVFPFFPSSQRRILSIPCGRSVIRSSAMCSTLFILDGSHHPEPVTHVHT